MLSHARDLSENAPGSGRSFTFEYPLSALASAPGGGDCGTPGSTLEGRGDFVAERGTASRPLRERCARYLSVLEFQLFSAMRP